jgi:DNA-binding transcriptional LysR family regulator
MTAAREGSFTRAAGVLLLSEPAVSQQVRLLETTVGARLFERSPRRPIRLTDAGGLLLQTCESVFHQFDATLEQLDALGGAQTARVILGVGTSFGSYVLPPIVAAFQKEHPGISVVVDIETVPHWSEKLRRREVDLAVAAATIDDDEIVSHPLAQKELVWIGLSGHPLAGPEPVPLDALQSERLVLRPTPSSSRQALDRLAQAQGLALHPTFELAGTEACITAVASGMGIALVPYDAVLAREQPRSFAVLNVKGFPLKLNWSVIWRANELSAAATTFRDYLLHHYEEMAVETAPAGLSSAPPTVRVALGSA